MEVKKIARALLMAGGAWAVAYATVALKTPAAFMWWGLMAIGTLLFYVVWELK